MVKTKFQQEATLPTLQYVHVYEQHLTHVHSYMTWGW